VWFFFFFFFFFFVGFLGGGRLFSPAGVQSHFPSFPSWRLKPISWLFFLFLPKKTPLFFPNRRPNLPPPVGNPFLLFFSPCFDFPRGTHRFFSFSSAAEGLFTSPPLRSILRVRLSGGGPFFLQFFFEGRGGWISPSVNINEPSFFPPPFKSKIKDFTSPSLSPFKERSLLGLAPFFSDLYPFKNISCFFLFFFFSPLQTGNPEVLLLCTAFEENTGHFPSLLQKTDF